VTGVRHGQPQGWFASLADPDRTTPTPPAPKTTECCSHGEKPVPHEGQCGAEPDEVVESPAERQPPPGPLIGGIRWTRHLTYSIGALLPGLVPQHVKGDRTGARVLGGSGGKQPNNRPRPNVSVGCGAVCCGANAQFAGPERAVNIPILGAQLVSSDGASTDERAVSLVSLGPHAWHSQLEAYDGSRVT